MSDLSPFETGGELPANPVQESNLDIFKPPLAGFDWVAYEERQGRLDQVLASGSPERLATLLHELQAADPETGIKLNNIHNTVLRGEFVGFMAPLSVMSGTVVDADMPGLEFRGGVAPRASFVGKNLRGANFIDSVLPQANFREADLRGAEFSNVVLSGVDFTDAKLLGADFTGAYIVGVKGLDDPEVIQGVDLTAARTVITDEAVEGKIQHYLASHFGDAKSLETIKRKVDPVPIAIDQTIPRLQTKRILRGLVGIKLQANEVDFTSSQLIGSHFEDLSANGVIFRNAALSGSIISRAMMREADLFSAWAPGVIIEDTNLRGARLTNANLVGSILHGVDLREVIGLDAKDTNLEGMIIEDCKLPQGYGYDGFAIKPSDRILRQLES
ncbi:pentapeptide repeat-containing protein [Candidatus Saccharibacteria bacterium]|nr:pentapeptide repeat-containing protein [Candidatus Saccharibacteria bacterium]